MIPTPVLVNDTRTRLDGVFVLYKTRNHVAVRQIHVWDGQRFLERFIVNNGHGDKTKAFPFLEGQNTFNIGSDPEVLFGIGISIQVEFGVEGVEPFAGGGSDHPVRLGRGRLLPLG